MLTVTALAAAFLAGMVGVVYLSLRGEELKVPELVGKDYYETKKEMESAGLKLNKRATRYSEEKPNTILEQLPQPGETVKTGQTILVDISEANSEGNEAPATIKKPETSDENTTDDITDIAPDKPKTSKNSNVKKPSQTTRDVITNKSNKNSNSNSSGGNSNDSGSSNSKSPASGINKGNKNTSPVPTDKPTPISKPSPAIPKKTEPVKPAAAKTPGSGETRPRKTP
ncbi:MAG: PASTA domain-containing protein [Pyrinomonadaceae bacterium]